MMQTHVVVVLLVYLAVFGTCDLYLQFGDEISVTPRERIQWLLTSASQWKIIAVPANNETSMHGLRKYIAIFFRISLMQRIRDHRTGKLFLFTKVHISRGDVSSGANSFFCLLCSSCN